MAKQNLSEKICTKCGNLKELGEFYKRNRGKYLTSHCRSCIVSYTMSKESPETRRRYYQKHKEVIKAKHKKMRLNNLEHKIRHVWRNSKQHAKVRGVSHTISYEDCYELYASQGGICAMSGETMQISGDRYLSNMLSLDRIDSNLGYDIDNIQWVCVKYNMMKAHMDMETFLEMCRRITEFNIES